MRWSILGSLFLVAIVAVISVLNSQGLAKGPLGEKWPSSKLVSIDQIDHSAFNALLNRYVDSDGYVNYKAWRSSRNDRSTLQTYLSELAKADPTQNASRESQLAFWINAYNAVTLEGILQVYPTSSIRKHTSKFGGYNIWDDLPLLVAGKPYSLNDIEHKVLRKMGEPRIHFAIVCASVGCPRLLNSAYVPEKLDDQLMINSKDFFSRQQNFKINNAGTVEVSSILKWFGEDFGNSQVERFKYLQQYVPQNAQQYVIKSNVRVVYQDYNWSLNDQATKPVVRKAPAPSNTRYNSKPKSGTRTKPRSGTR